MIKLNLLLECSLLTPKTVLDWIKSPLVITMMVKIRAWTLRPSSVTPIELRINNKHINQNVINERIDHQLVTAQIKQGGGGWPAPVLCNGIE